MIRRKDSRIAAVLTFFKQNNLQPFNFDELGEIMVEAMNVPPFGNTPFFANPNAYVPMFTPVQVLQLIAMMIERAPDDFLLEDFLSHINNKPS